MRAALALATAISVSGCSFALVTGPPDNHRELPYVSCTESRLGPVLDTVWTGLQVTNMISTAALSTADYEDIYDGNPPWSKTTAYLINGGLALLGAAGMYYGFTRTARCREAKVEWAERGGIYNQGPNPPPPGTWPPAPSAP